MTAPGGAYPTFARFPRSWPRRNKSETKRRKTGKSSIVEYKLAISREVATSSASVWAAYDCKLVAKRGESQSSATISAKRATPRRASGKPVDSRGSTNPAADGNNAQFLPTIALLRNDRRGMRVKGRSALAVANCSRSAGILCRIPCHAFAPSASFHFAAN